MLKINDEIINLKHFPDGTFALKHDSLPMEMSFCFGQLHYLTWLYESEEELVALIYITKHLQEKGASVILNLDYVPNGRMDRVENPYDVFTLKHFAEVINWLEFEKVWVLDPHSSVSTALIDRVNVKSHARFIRQAIQSASCNAYKFMLFFPDEGAVKRYGKMFSVPYAFGIKRRDWETGQIQGLDVAGRTDLIKDSTVLIVDDICSRGGTFFHSAKKLKELGAKEIYLYVTHCENTILEGDLLNSGLIKKIYTTNSIFTGKNERIEVFDCEE